MAAYRKVAQLKDLAPGSGMAVEARGHQIALFNVDGTVYAIEGTCTHRGGPLGEGSLEGTTVTCPWHSATFDVRTGDHLTAPAPQGVSSCNVKIAGDDIHVESPESSS